MRSLAVSRTTQQQEIAVAHSLFGLTAFYLFLQLRFLPKSERTSWWIPRLKCSGLKRDCEDVVCTVLHVCIHEISLYSAFSLAFFPSPRKWSCRELAVPAGAFSQSFLLSPPSVFPWGGKNTRMRQYSVSVYVVCGILSVINSIERVYATWQLRTIH